MKALILAAGRGARMRPLTDELPKPLLPVHGKPLIEWHLEALARGGVRQVVINTAWLEDRIVAALGDGGRWGLAIRYSMEGRDFGQALETAGGMRQALPWLVEAPDDPFWLVSADIHAPGFRFDVGRAAAFAATPDLQAHLWLVPNPTYHPDGDFSLDASGRATTRRGAAPRWTYANLALCRASLCSDLPPGSRAALGPLLFERAEAGRISAEVYTGAWENVGTPAQLAALNGVAPMAHPAQPAPQAR